MPGSAGPSATLGCVRSCSRDRSPAARPTRTPTSTSSSSRSPGRLEALWADRVTIAESLGGWLGGFDEVAWQAPHTFIGFCDGPVKVDFFFQEGEPHADPWLRDGFRALVDEHGLADRLRTAAPGAARAARPLRLRRPRVGLAVGVPAQAAPARARVAGLPRARQVRRDDAAGRVRRARAGAVARRAADAGAPVARGPRATRRRAAGRTRGRRAAARVGGRDRELRGAAPRLAAERGMPLADDLAAQVLPVLTEA